uniref:Uncharacterized protein n=1 Tax=Anguilla anguilla TaxID=7936 RepID=A0A0E9TJ46_ANGAN
MIHCDWVHVGSLCTNSLKSYLHNLNFKT